MGEREREREGAECAASFFYCVFVPMTIKEARKGENRNDERVLRRHKYIVSSFSRETVWKDKKKKREITSGYV